MLFLYTYYITYIYYIHAKLNSATVKLFVKAKQQILQLLADYARALCLVSLDCKTVSIAVSLRPTNQ